MPADQGVPRRPSRLGLPTWQALALSIAAACVALLRLADLGGRAMHHDESLDAWFSWRLATGQGYEYDPVYHGPLRIIVTAGFFRLFGAGDTVARLLPALCGLALIATPLLVRRTLGRVGTATAMVALAISPTMVYFARFGREDTTFAFAATVCMLAIVEMLRAPRAWLPPVIGVSAAAAWAVKESFFITAFIVVTYLVVAGVAMRGGRPWREHPFVARITAVGADPWWWALAGFLAVFVTSYTVFFTDPAGLWRGLFGGLEYWLGQHEVNRGSQPVGFYAVLLVAYEWPLVVLGIAGAVTAIRRPGPVELFLVWSAVAHVIVYSWAGERYPWLLVHQVVPLALLSGLAVDRAVTRVRTAGRGVIAAGAVAAVAMTSFAVATAVRTAHVDDTDPRELMVVVQAGPPVLEVARRLDTVAERVAAEGERTPVILIDADAAGSWPMGWYLRDTPGAQYPSLGGGVDGPFDAAIVLERSLAAIDTTGYVRERFPIRSTWVVDWGAADAGDWWRWLTRREVWNDTQSEWMWLLVADEHADLLPSGQ